MGTWSTNPFGNDSALDWAFQLESCTDSSFITNTIDNVAADCSEPDVRECTEFIAAAAVVNSSGKNPVKGLPLNVKQWVLENGYYPTIECVNKTVTGLEIVLDDSELAQLWQESASHSTWVKNTNQLLNLLKDLSSQSIVQRVPKSRPIPRLLHKLCEYPDALNNAVIRDKIKAKLKKLPDVNVQHEDPSTYYTPLILMCRHQFYDEVRLLIELGADVNNLAGICEYECLAYMCRDNQHQLIEHVFDMGGVVDQKITQRKGRGGKLENRADNFIFFVGLSNADETTIKLLVKHGVDPTLKDVNGESALHYSAKRGNAAGSAYLLELGLEPNSLTDRFDHTPLTFAVEGNHLDVAALLLEHHTDPNTFDISYVDDVEKLFTPLDCAYRESNAEMVELLLRHGAKRGIELDRNE